MTFRPFNVFLTGSVLARMFVLISPSFAEDMPTSLYDRSGGLLAHPFGMHSCVA